VKLLLDQNRSPRLVDQLADVFPNSMHVQSVGLDRAKDDSLWAYARKDGFVILRKDEDFNDLAIMRGFPPKVVWLQKGNCTTGQVEEALRSHQVEIEAFEADPNAGTFILR